jgi:large repetitive protein
LTTFQLGNFSFAGNIYTVPSGVQTYSQQIDLTTTKGIVVNVTAGLDTTTGTVTWTFTSIDPATGKAITNPTQGFLPAEGSGNVGYTIQPKASLADGTVISAQASITFDKKPPVQTAAVFNTIEQTAPTSSIDPLPAVASSPNFTVAWTGSTANSGAAYYNVYVSTNNGEYVLWQKATVATSATYNGRAGDTYAFYSVATDRAGLTETTHAAAKVVTVVVTPTLALSLDSGSSQSDGITNSGVVTVTGLETGATSQYSLDAGTTWMAFTGNSFTLTGDGAKSVAVRQTDLAGHISSSSAPLNFTLDTAAPVAPTTTLTHAAGANSGVVNITGLEPTGTSQYSLDTGNTWTTFTGNSFTLTGDGAKSVTVRQVDLAGNISSSSTPLSFTLGVAVTAPTVALANDTGNSSSDGITNSGVVNVTGLVSGAIGQYSLDAGKTWTVFTGNSFTLTGDGSKSVSVRQTDVAGNVSGSSTPLSFTLDGTAIAPTLTLAVDSGSSQSDGITNSGIVTVTGLETGATSQYSLDDGKNWVTFTNNSFTLTGDGAKSVTVRQTDLAGNISSSSAALNVTLDTTAISPALALSVDSGSSQSDGTTNSGLVTVTGLETGSTSQYSLNGGTNWTTFTGNSFTLTGDGAKSVIVRQTDLAGNVSSGSTPLNFTLDTTVIAPIFALANDTGISSTDGITSSGVVNVTGIETGANSQYSLNGGTTWTQITGNSFTLTGDGAKSVIVRQTDLAGNVSSGATPLNLTLDTTALAPTLTLAVDSGSSQSDGITNSGVVTVTGLETGANNQYSLNGGTNWTTFTGNSFTLTGDGAKSVIVRQTDLAGNVSSGSAPLKFTLDTVAPNLPTLKLAKDTGISSSDGFTNSGLVNVTGLDTGLTSQYSLNGGTTWTQITGNSFTLTGDGAKSVTVRQTDLAGNIATSSPLNFTLATAAATPTLTLTKDTGTSSTDGITNSGVVSVSGLAPGATSQYSINSGKTWTTITGNSFTLTGDGVKSVVVRQTDLAGNVSSISTPFTFMLDTVAPNAPTLVLVKSTGSSNEDNEDAGISSSGVVTNSGVVNVSKLETVATSQYSLDSGNTWTTITGTSFTLTGDGNKSVKVRQIDLAGNVSTSSSALSFTLDTTVIAPTLALAKDTGISSTDGITNSGVVNIAGMEAGATSQYSLNGGNTWTKINGSSFNLTDDGTKSVIVRQTDLAGNVSTNSTTLNFTLDTKASTAPTIGSINADANATNITLNGTAEANSTVSIYKKVSESNQQSIGTATTNNQGMWSFTTQGIAPGHSSFDAKATDVAGNLSPFSTLVNLTLGTNGNDTLVATTNDDTDSGFGGNNTLIGGAGNDTLIGGTGNSILSGGAGNDVFVFDSHKLLKQIVSGVDTITDFTVGQDKIQLSKLVFKTNVTAATGSSLLAAANFSTVTTDAAAATAATAIVYNSADGKLFYNPNLAAAGFGGGTSDGQFAQLTAGLNLTYKDFTVTA